MTLTRLLLVDDSPEFVGFMRLLLEEIPQMEVVGDCPSAEAALARLDALRPDLVLMDWSMGADVAQQVAVDGRTG